MRILLIDDSEDIGDLVKEGLFEYSILQATSATEGEKMLKREDYRLLLIDVDLPDGNGFDLCRQLSRDMRYQHTPKILLTAKDAASEKVYGFNCGADDYVTKPFNPIELRARVDRYLRRSNSLHGAIFSHAGFLFQMDFLKCSTIVDGKQVDLSLTPTEFRLFLTLVKNEGRALSRQDIEKTSWVAYGATILSRGIDTHIAHLRKKLGPQKGVIVSVYGQGYAFVTDASLAKSA